ncbi:MAG: hypothetical protein PHG00_00165 [Methylococcales bacterium]|nr:hypothetical protein [Methylococcales bacterium]
MKFSQFGSDNGRLVVYFHGAPGAPKECNIFDPEGKNHGLMFICLDPIFYRSVHSWGSVLQTAAEILRITFEKQVDVIGFSIGAFIALQTFRYMTNGVGSLHLVAAAAPLETGNYLEAMAGKQVFKLAKAALALFILLSYWQGLLAAFSQCLISRVVCQRRW